MNPLYQTDIKRSIMKHLFFILFAFTLFACNPQTNEMKALQNRVDSLEIKLANNYKPGLGDFMGGLQKHHSKLWFAGQNQNWELADFEIHELEEAIEDIEAYHKGRKEIEQIDMIKPALEGVEAAIDQKDPIAFTTGYNILTNTCNACHQAADHGFIVIKTPESPPFSNQEFEVRE